ncbi:MAG TPA: hypothetical protein O0X39_06440 [Methanocorpusculum sp.]|nr:hypothetical protein [Methanocorpusculum sp.]
MGFLGDVERALGVWYKDPDAKPHDTDAVVKIAVRQYVIDRLGNEFTCAERDFVIGEPDLIAMRESDDKKFNLVTLFRSQMFCGEDGEAYLPWTTEETYAKLCAYEAAEGEKITVVICLHGFADRPDFVFAVPLRDAKPDLKKSVLAKYEKGKTGPLL